METELATASAELSALERPMTSFVATGEGILRTRETGRDSLQTQDPAGSGDCSIRCYRTAPSIAEVVYPTYKKPFDLFA